MSLPHIILGWLTLAGSQSGYDLKQRIDTSTQHFWYCDLSQIYRALDSLVQEGWAVAQEDASSSRQRKTYTITRAGENALREWLAEDITLEQERVPLLAKLFFGNFGEVEDQRRQILTFQAELRARLELFQQFHAILEEDRLKKPVLNSYFMLTLDMGRRVSEALLGWCEATLDSLAEIESLRSSRGENRA